MNRYPRILLAVGLATVNSLVAQPPTFTIQNSGDTFDLFWPATQSMPDGSVKRPYFELQNSDDLTHWQPFGERQRALTTAPGQSLHATDPGTFSSGFFRLLTLEPANSAPLASGGAEVFGYRAAFGYELNRVGQISPATFASRFPSPTNYLPSISWDATTAQFWDAFNADPAVVNAGKQQGQPGYRTFDTRLNSSELSRLKFSGFVVSERLGNPSFGQSFYDLWHNDLPVFISTDAILQAWHRTYDGMLQEIEETYLSTSVGNMLDGMAGQIAAADAISGSGVLRDSLRDADWYIAVARSLLAGINQPPVASVLGQDMRVAATLNDIKALQLKRVDDFMGFCRMVDFSQFQVRGHYTRSETLGRYFQCATWLGRIDLPVAGGPFERCVGDVRMAAPRELGTAIVFWHLLQQSGKFQKWADMEKIITAFVGWTDSLNFGQMNGLMAGAGIQSLEDVKDQATLEQVQANLAKGELGAQNIRSDWYSQPISGLERYALPKAFTVFGQKFTPDSWALSQTVFSSILWTENGITNKVNRRVPGALDVAFATLGNNQVVPNLQAQMNGLSFDQTRPHALAFRDGKPYQHNLSAVRAVMDAQKPEAWSENLYLGWLDCLRQLSPPSTTANYPEAMRTRAWAMKTLNTQLASWTHLRHDTILYTQASYTDFAICVYPKGYVEPRVEFWHHLKTLANRAASLIESLSYDGSFNQLSYHPPQLNAMSGQFDLGVQASSTQLPIIQSRQVAHLRNFAAVAERLETLAQKELAQECFTPEDLQFMDGLMEEKDINFLHCSRVPTFNGWYPKLFYRAIYWPDDALFRYTYGCEAFDSVVADIHTDVPSEGDSGSVLNEAVGRANMLLMAVDNGADHFICAGPVLSHYEFELTGSPRRLTDEEWQQILGDSAPPAFPFDVPSSRLEGLTPPLWTQGYLVKMPKPRQ